MWRLLFGSRAVPLGATSPVEATAGSAPSLPYAARLREASVLGATLVAGMSAAALIGWAIRAPALDRIAPDLPPIKANAALAFLLASGALLAYAQSRPRSRLRRAGAAGAMLVLVIGMATLAEYVFGWRLGIDQLLFSDAVSTNAPYPGRPSVNAALGFVLLGAALSLWDVRLGRWWATNVLAWLAAIVGLLALTGYAIGAGWLVSFDARQQIALNAAIALSVLPLAILLARPDRGTTAILAGAGPGGLVLRRMLPAAIGLPVALAALTLSGPRLHLFSERFGVWLFASAVTVALVAAVWLVAVASERAGHQRTQLEGMMLALAQTASDAIAVVDRAGRIIYTNAALAGMFGYERDALTGQPSELLFSQSERDGENERFARLLSGAEPAGVNRVSELMGVRADGVEFPIELSTAVWVAGGEPVVARIIRDVSTRHRAEQQVRGLLESAPDAIVVADAAGEIVVANARAETMFGYAREELIGRSVELLMPESKRDAHVRMRAGYASDPRPRGSSRPGDFTARHKDGTLFPVEITLNPIHTDDGLLVSSAIRDVTDRRRAERAMARVAAIVASSPNAIIGVAADGTIESWNAGAEKLYGHTPEEAIGRPITIVNAPEHAGSRGHLDGALAGATVAFESEDVRRDGTRIKTAVTISPIRDGSGQVTGVSCLAQDITERKRAERALAEAEERFRRAFDEAPIGMALISDDAVLEKANTALGATCGYARHELEGMALRSLLHPADIDTGLGALRELAAGGAERVTLDLRMIPAVGSAVDVAVHATRLAGGPERAPQLLCQFLDVTDRKLYEERLQFMADHDPLTGLLNRRKFESELERHVEHVKRYGPEGAVLVLDIDNFKTINDTLGHNAGDQLIVSIASVLRQRLRASDTLVRLGGDEFAVLLPKADHDEAAEVAEAIVDAIRTNSKLLDGGRKRLTTSLGIAMFTADVAQLSGESILIEADLAMYDAKDAGRDQYAFYETSEHRVSRTQARLTWANRIDDALENDRFVLLAQPILDLRTDRIRQYELLIRMLDDHDELIPPAAFLYIAERFGSIAKVDEWVASQAIELIEHHPQLHLEINISGKSLGDHTLLHAIDDRLRASRIDPTHLIFEVTETAAVANLTHAQTFAQHLRDLGCRFALDDFGAGFGSFYYLKHLPFDYVKIDGEFVKHATGGQIDRLVIEAVVRIAQGLGKETIAEFVTNDQTQRMVRRLGVDYAQGYHIGEPAALATILDRAILEQS
jgi:diguanylate cyclase (GGDEF)-like protein/PAS domain S-box-containing protein